LEENLHKWKRYININIIDESHNSRNIITDFVNKDSQEEILGIMSSASRSNYISKGGFWQCPMCNSNNVVLMKDEEINTEMLTHSRRWLKCVDCNEQFWQLVDRYAWW